MFIKNLPLVLLLCSICLESDPASAVMMRVSTVPVVRPSPPPPPPVSPPALAGDVVGRNLIAPAWVGFFGIIGHVGMWDGSSQIIEVLNEGGNVIRINSLADFSTRSTYWGAVHPNIPNYKISAFYGTNSSLGNYETVNTRMAILKKAWQQYLIGADYTYGAQWQLGYPTQTPRFGPTDPPLRGLYRCDTFIIALYDHTVQPLAAGTASDYWPDQTWVDRVHGIAWTVPISLFERLATWQ